MGLYDGKINLHLPKFGFDFEWKKFKNPLLFLAAVLVVLFFAFSIYLVIMPKALSFTLLPNPLDTAKDSTSYLTITVKNITDATATDVAVFVEAQAPDSINVFPAKQTISTIEKGGVRTLEPFAISPNPSVNVYSGTYFFTISTTINGKQFVEYVALELKN